MNLIGHILWRAVQLLEHDTPAMHLSVETALRTAHKELSKFWGHLPLAQAAILDQLELEKNKLPMDQWLHFTGEDAKKLLPVIKAAALSHDEETYERR